MNNSINKELAAHIISRIQDGVLTNDNIDDWHHECFNADHYIIGYYQASEWLKEHNIDSFDAIRVVKEYEEGNFGEFTTDVNSESIVNMYVYVKGMDLLCECNAESIEELTEYCEGV